MKTELTPTAALLLRLTVMAFLAATVCAQPRVAPDTDVYSIYPSGGYDDGTSMNWYYGYWAQHRDLRALGLAEPLAEQLPSSRDTNGHWGTPADGFQLSVRFHRRAFVPGAPVEAMVLLRNLAPTPRIIESRAYGKSAARKNFAFTLHSGTNLLSWSWKDPKLPDLIPDGFRPPRYFQYPTMEPHSERAYFVRLDEIFDLSQPGEYFVQASWTDSAPTEQVLTNVVSGEPAFPHRLRVGYTSVITNVVSGQAAFQIVEKLSPSQVAATDAFARELHETERRANDARLNAQYRRLHGLTNKPPER